MGGEPALSLRPASAALASTRAPMRVLVVDDLPEICAFFRDIRRRIRSVDLQLETETNSQRAMDLLREQPFDLVVSDFRMREANGIDVLRAARQSNPKGYRILMTGYNEIPAPIQRIQEAQVDAYIQKPLDTQELLLILLSFIHDDKRSILELQQHAREIETLATQEEEKGRGAGGAPA